MDHIVSLSVGTIGADDHAQVFQDISELSANLAVAHGYVSVSSQLVDDIDDDDPADDCPKEHTRYDEHTLSKVREALWNVLRESSASQHIDDQLVTDCINEMQNAGILFRERI